MQKKITLILAIVFVLLIFTGLFLYLLSDDEGDDLNQLSDISLVKKEPKTMDKIKVWVKGMAKIKQQSYAYPVNDVFIEVEFLNDISNDLKKEKIYRLTVGKRDDTVLFSVLQILANKKINYTIINDDSQFVIYLVYINLDDKKMLKEIVRELKNYGITSKITEV